MSIKKEEASVYFDDPRLRMGLFGRLTVRVAGYVGNLVLAVACFSLLFASIGWARYLGLLFLLFLMDRFIHRGEADKPIPERPKEGPVNVALFMRPSAFLALERAYDKSLISKTSLSLEALRELLNLPEIQEGLARMDVELGEVRQKTEEFLHQSVQMIPGDHKQKKEAAQEIAVKAFEIASLHNDQFVEPASLFSALPHTSKDDFVSRLFNLFEIESDDLAKAMMFGVLKKQFYSVGRMPGSVGEFVRGPKRSLRHRVMNRAWTSRPTPTLDRYSYDLTDLARQEKVGFLIGHRLEFDRLVDVLSRSANPNVLLVGEVGVGKETLISHLAFQIIKDRVPPPLFDKRLVSLSISNLVAGAAPEELQARLDRIINEIIAAGNIILHVPDIHNLVRTSGTAYLSAADALMPIFMDNAFPIIGATFPKEYRENLEPRTDFNGIFERIQVSEITEDEAERLLVYESLILERDSGVMVTFGAIKKAVKLARKYFRNKFLPSSAEELLKNALAEAKRRKEVVLGPNEIIRTAEAKVNIPIHEASEAEAAALVNLEEIIHERLVGQEEAVHAVANVLREYRSGLSKPGGPIASFLFVGPTGVGKTELSKILAKVQFGSIDLMVRFDMSEYQDKQSFYRFIGSPDGKISGALTEAITQKPYSLILLDEFEKAFPDILDLFLQVFDDGRLTDNLGRTVDFQNTIIIATSNAQSDIINDALRQGQTMSQIAEYLKSKLTDTFKPELLNRFSKIVVFNNLSPGDLEKIALINLNGFSKLVAEQGVGLKFSLEAVRAVAKLGYEPAFGARPINRVIEERLRAPLAEKILKREVQKGKEYQVTFEDEAFKFVLMERNG
ncbi:MAG: ATP-dependent Clp protease ATP-binding subunit ClpC [Parcubacteria group bacterium Gr01-1014_20]|nr:MAG: ATP-dependent Clp protease ATP-binding subunit ClpC [Parcubacteria group bacterium Gr01-1014_20]